MEAAKFLGSKCEGCGGERCLGCGNHLNGEVGGICLGCSALNWFDEGALDEVAKDRLMDAAEKLESRSSGCPQCQSGRMCNPVCGDCAEQEMSDRMDFEREHWVGRE